VASPTARDRHPLARDVRSALSSGLQDAPTGTGVLLSGGVDSQAVIRALVMEGKDPEALSFTLPGGSRDYAIARQTARKLGVPFRPVLLDPDPYALRRYVDWAVRYGLRSKTAIECFWPRRAAIDTAARLKLPALATGDGGDGYFAISKKAVLHYKDRMDEFRDWYFGRPDWSQTATIRRYAGQYGLEVYMPLDSDDLRERFRGWGWDALNLPRQKQPIRDVFPELQTLPPHVNLQLGDSGIAELFAEVFRSPRSAYHEAGLSAEREEEGQLPLA
jgi:asparagine synthetase B (glutamine-hydrolysing)